MNATVRTGLIAVSAIAVVVLLASVFVVQQTQTALVLRFGAVQQVRSAGAGLPSGLAPGLHFKFPLIDNVVYFDRRILDLDLPAQEVIASDQKRLVVDAFARYRILDPLRFYQSVNSIAGANNRLGSIVNSTVRSVLGDATFEAVVRSERQALMKTSRSRTAKRSSSACRPSVSARRRTSAPKGRRRRRASGRGPTAT